MGHIADVRFGALKMRLKIPGTPSRFREQALEQLHEGLVALFDHPVVGVGFLQQGFGY